MMLLKNKIFVFFAILFIIKPAGIDTTGGNIINLIFNIGRIIAVVLIILYYFIKHNKIGKLIIFEIIYFLCLFFTYFINKSSFSSIIIFSISIVTISLLFKFCIISGNSKMLLDALFLNYFILLTYNFINILIYSGWNVGIHNTVNESFSILNSDNGTASYIFPAIYVALILAQYNKKKYYFPSMILIFIAFLTEVKLWSATALIGIVIVFISYIFIINNFNKFKFNTYYLIYISIIINILITFFKVQYLFSSLITQVLNRSITLTGRTKFWEIGLEGFKHSPIFGNGIETYYIDNMFIQILYRGGLITLFVFLYLILLVIKKRNKNNHIRDIGNILLSAIMIMSISESWNSFMGFFVIIILVYYSDYITVNTDYCNKVKKVRLYNGKIFIRKNR